MLKLCRATKVKVFFLVVVYIFNFDLFEISAAILEKGLLDSTCHFAPAVAVHFVEFFSIITTFGCLRSIDGLFVRSLTNRTPASRSSDFVNHSV